MKSRSGMEYIVSHFADVLRAGVAQLVEHLFCKQVVRGSSPLASSDKRLSILLLSLLLMF